MQFVKCNPSLRKSKEHKLIWKDGIHKVGTCVWQGRLRASVVYENAASSRNVLWICEASLDFPPAWGWVDTDWIFHFLGQIFPLRLLNTISQVHFTRLHKKLRGDFGLIIQLNFSSPQS